MVGSTVQVSGSTANNFTNTVTYTVVAEDNSTQNYTVTVSIPVTGVTLDKSDWNDLINSTQEQLTATVHPSDATNKNVTWQSSDPTDYSVSSTGLVKWLGGGSTTLVVTVTTQDGGFTATCSGSASCPIVYAGDGKGAFNYVTDLQGPIIGIPGSTTISTNTGLFTYDYVALPGLKADPDGRYQVKLREIQAEIEYLDEVKLVPVDVPNGYEIASSSAEHTWGNGFLRPRHFYTLKEPRTLVSAVDQRGNDVTSKVKQTDGVPAPVDPTDSPSYDLDFGFFDPAHAKLVIEAWAMYSSRYTTQTFAPPSVELKNASGQWVPVKTFGVPGGDEKTMVYDISGLFPSPDRHIRLKLGSRPWVRWVLDSVRLDDSAPVDAIVGNDIEAATSVLSRAGLATMVIPDFLSRGRVLDDTLPFNGVGLGQGRLTRYGDVRELMGRADDKFVIFGMGDQVLMTFGPLAGPPEGYHRVMVLKILHYYKAPYVNTNVAELPFRGMSAYPYPTSEHYPNDAEHLTYLARYNTRENK